MKKLVLITLCVVFVFSSAVGLFAEEKPKIGFALLWTVNDLGWTTAHAKGILTLQAVLGNQIEIITKEKVVNESDAETVMRDFIAQGCTMIFGTTWEHMNAMKRLAKEYPDIVFEHCSGYEMNDTNFGNYFMRMYQGEYLAGYMAGLMGFKDVGTVATRPIPEPIRGINAFTIGLQKGLKEAGVKHDPKKLNYINWLMEWKEVENEPKFAQMHVAKGRTLIRQMQ